MAGISDEDIQKVRDASDVVAVIGERVPVKQKGRDFWCCCPLHQEKTPSFKIDPSTQLWHCFGCGEGGDVFSFVMKTEDLTFPEAVRRLAERAHIDIVEEGGRGIPASRKARLKEVCARTAEFYHTQLMRGRGPEADAARSYLAGRGFGGDVPNTWNLGFAPGRGALVRHLSQLGFSTADMIDANVALAGRGGPVRDRFYNRVMFPIFDVSGDCIAFGGRVIGTGEPKYLNSQETPLFHKSQVLYGLDHAKAAMASSGVAIVVEGYTDVIALHEAGIKNVVATLGTALTLRHIRVLSRHASKRIVYLFDGDAAGQRAADRALAFIDKSMTPEAGRSQVDLVAVTLPDNLDPAEFVAARGADALRALVDDAKPLLEYGIERRLANHDLQAAEGRARALEDCLGVLAPIKESILAKDYAVRLAGRLRLRENDVLEALAAKEPPRFQSRDDEDAPLAAAPPRPVRTLSRAERNRLRFEREFLGLVAQNPSVGLAHADALAQIQWHEDVHRLLADSILATLAENPAAAGVDIVTRAALVTPHAARVLTGSLGREGASAEETGAYLAEELALGDAEDAIGALRAQLAAGVTSEEAELLHTAIATLQMDVAARRVAHRAMPHS
ncbi:DNA primase [Adlercreutzia sp. R21]|uniref:DNA primase n=1 Tax=Adlercreutzia wanghongyangiae TaxID=3111451 RepID=A0ABU6IHS7_9ACTN|nr:DNA primase [Adlercreutzia sp. R21]MEC4175976.1 DNA primase [Adlercreutzia sp. R7]MEC4184038.1 DNA primase [Adlercreutzia sp. R21]